MTRQAIIERTVEVINRLPDEKATEISDFAEYIMMKYEEQSLLLNIQQLVSDSNAFDFLRDEEDLPKTISSLNACYDRLQKVSLDYLTVNLYGRKQGRLFLLLLQDV